MSGYIPKAASVEWYTPPDVVAVVREALGGRIDLDPCAAPDRREHFAGVNLAAPASDGLAEAWRGTAYVNPPFSALADWAAKCASEARLGAEVILLLPARTDTRYWHEHVATAQAVCFWRGRMRFSGAPASCPFPVALVYWGPHPWLFREALSPRGMVVVPSRPAAPSLDSAPRPPPLHAPAGELRPGGRSRGRAGGTPR